MVTTSNKVIGQFEDLYFDKETDIEAAMVLNSLWRSKKRVKIYYGDKETGKNWYETYDIFGRIGRTTGTKKAPILVYSKRSYGGGLISTNCILAIRESSIKGAFLYQHPNFVKPTVKIVKEEEDKYNVLINGIEDCSSLSYKDALFFYRRLV